ncbi:aldose 1-epimerase [Rubellimicrobium arenae]|uniref:aldose 1-epimerase n=1 Tax=Rubellimicrobium arenae TaxID=2817372 RepID=UPI001B30EF62|nr:aldose 1-epimerase [Rubellimicrobium arenae]
MSQITLLSGTTTARIETAGGCLMALECGGLPLLRPTAQGAAPIDSACYPLVPFGNRIRDNTFDFEGHTYRLEPNTDWDRHYLHGEGWRSDWAVISQQPDHLVLSHHHDGTAIPYVYDAEQTFALTEDGLRLTLTVVNRGERAMPFGLGWHPYFPMTPDTTLETRAERMWSEEEGWLPGTPGPIPAELDFSVPRPLPHHWVNNGFEGWSGRARISWPERRASLVIEADAVFRTMFLFVSDTSFDPDYRRDFFALEPMTHLADGHNQAVLGGLSVLRPSETLSGSVTFRMEALPDGR